MGEFGPTANITAPVIGRLVAGTIPPRGTPLAPGPVTYALTCSAGELFTVVIEAKSTSPVASGNA